MIIIVSGLPGSGKSYFAQALADRLGAVYLNTDRVRNAEGAREKYSTDDKLRIYRIMAERTRETVLAGNDIVVDGTFYLTAMIDLFWMLSVALSTPICFISVAADESLIKERLSRPRNDSEADWDVYLRVKKEAEPLQVPHLTIQSGDGNIDKMLTTVLDHLQKNR